MKWMLPVFILIGCGSQEAREVSLVIQLPSAISQNANRRVRFMKRVRYLLVQVGEDEPVLFPPEQWDQLPLSLPEGDDAKIKAAVWDLDREGKTRSYAVMSGSVIFRKSEVQGPVLLKLTSRISAK